MRSSNFSSTRSIFQSGIALKGFAGFWCPTAVIWDLALGAAIYVKDSHFSSALDVVASNTAQETAGS